MEEFKPTPNHQEMYEIMKTNRQRILEIKEIVDDLGYYNAIQFLQFITNGAVDEEVATLMIDIATNLETFEKRHIMKIEIVLN